LFFENIHTLFQKHSYILPEPSYKSVSILVFFYFLLFTYFIFAVLRTRGRGGRIVWFECENFVQCQTKEQAVEQQQQLVQDQWGWWLFDRSILTRYEDHVAHRLWFGRLSD
jgi:cytochrome b561